MQYDLIIIGGGPGGYTGAIRAARLGLKVALVEKESLGGTCLNRGCIPTKTLLKSAELFNSLTEWKQLGVNALNVTYDEETVYKRKDNIVDQLKSGIQALLKANKVEVLKGKGYVKDKNTVVVNNDITLTTKNILLATGSSPAEFDPMRPLNGMQDTLNSDDVLATPLQEDSVIIVGGGVIAVEFAFYFINIGKQVAMLVSSDRILKNLSQDISRNLSMTLKKKGVKIILDARIKQLYKDKAEFIDKEENQTLQGRVITAIGRKSNLNNIGLENLSLKYDKYIRVDQNMQTEVEGVYACGDIIGGFMLAHYAAATAITAVESIANVKHSIDLSVCPACIYTSPEVAVVGRTTPLATDKTGKFMMGGNGKSVIEGNAKGYTKIITDENDRVVGGELFCKNATDIIGEVALLVQKGLTAKQGAEVIHPHPTIMEAVLESLEDIHGLSTHIPPKIN